MKNYQEVNKVNMTNDLEMFKTIKGNRVINPMHVKRLEQAIRSYGMLMSPILVNENYDVIDGHHRVLAAKRVKAPIYFIVVKGYTLNEVQVLNNNGKNWSKKDYLDSFVELEHPEYLKFQKFMEDFPMFNFSVCEKILLLRSSEKQELIESKRTTSRYFQKGELVIDNLKRSYQIAGMLLDIRPYFEGYRNNVFVSAMLSVFKNENYEHDVFIQKLQTRGAPKLDFCQNMEQYKLLIEEIFNFKNRDKKNLRY